MLFRELQKSDFDGIHVLVCQVHELHVSNRPDFYNDIDPCDEKYFDFLLEDPKALVLVAEDNGKIIGFCAVTLKEPPQNPLVKPRRVAYMEDLCIDAAYRKSGVGSALYNEMEKLVKEKGAEVMELMVWSFNYGARKFYENMGMFPRSIIMEKKL